MTPCGRLLTRARGFRTRRHRRSSFSRLDSPPQTSRSCRRAAAYFTPLTVTSLSTPFWRKAGTSLFTYKSRAWRMRYAQAQFQRARVRCKISRQRPSLPPPNGSRHTGKDGTPVFGEDDAAAPIVRRGYADLWTSSFVLSFPSSTSRRAGRRRGLHVSFSLRVRTVFFHVSSPLHCDGPEGAAVHYVTPVVSSLMFEI